MHRVVCLRDVVAVSKLVLRHVLGVPRAGRRRVQHAVDAQVAHVDALGRELLRHRLRQRAQAELGHAEGRPARPGAEPRGGAADEDCARFGLDHGGEHLAGAEEGSVAADFPGLLELLEVELEDLAHRRVSGVEDEHAGGPQGLAYLIKGRFHFLLVAHIDVDVQALPAKFLDAGGRQFAAFLLTGHQCHDVPLLRELEKKTTVRACKRNTTQ
mmetsp:Transcript_11533/g.22137  ORF Transcript_11533/g.22137 Transcript_11533/m.22137 type:complete len:213 (+) Transcript_11533:379-1017(+)